MQKKQLYDVSTPQAGTFSDKTRQNVQEKFRDPNVQQKYNAMTPEQQASVKTSLQKGFGTQQNVPPATNVPVAVQNVTPPTAGVGISTPPVQNAGTSQIPPPAVNTPVAGQNVPPAQNATTTPPQNVPPQTTSAGGTPTTPQDPNTTTGQIVAQMPTDFSVYASGQVELTPDSPEFMKYNQRLSRLNAISGLTADELGTYISTGKLKPGMQTMRDLQKFNPQLYQEAQRISLQHKSVSQINDNIDKTFSSAKEANKFSLAKGGEGEEGEVVDESPTSPVNDYISDELKSRFGPYAEMYYDVTQSLMNTPQVQRFRDDVFTKQDELNKIDTQLDDLYEEAGRVLGDEAPDYLRSAYVSTKAKEINRLRKPLLMELELAQNQLQMEVEQQMTLLDSVTQGMQTDLKNKQWEYQQQYEQQQDTIKNQLAQDKYDLSVQKMEQSEQNKILSGNGESEYSVAETTMMLSDGQFGDWCGNFANDISASTGGERIWKDSLESKKALATEKTPEVGSFVVMESAEFPENGHVGVVVGIDGGKISVRSSNAHGDKLISTDVYDATDPSIIGYHYPENMQTSGAIKGKFFDALKSGYDKIEVKGASGKTVEKSIWDKSVRDSMGYAGKTNREMQMDLSPKYIQGTVDNLDDDEALYQSLQQLSKSMAKVESGDDADLFRTPDQGMLALKTSGVKPEVALKVFTRRTKSMLSELSGDAVDIDDKTGHSATGKANEIRQGTSPVDAMADFLVTYPELSDEKQVLSVMQTIMSDDYFDEAVNEGDVLGLGIGSGMSEMFQKAKEKADKIRSENMLAPATGK